MKVECKATLDSVEIDKEALDLRKQTQDPDEIHHLLLELLKHLLHDVERAESNSHTVEDETNHTNE